MRFGCPILVGGSRGLPGGASCSCRLAPFLHAIEETRDIIPRSLCASSGRTPTEALFLSVVGAEKSAFRRLTLEFSIERVDSTSESSSSSSKSGGADRGIVVDILCLRVKKKCGFDFSSLTFCLFFSLLQRELLFLSVRFRESHASFAFVYVLIRVRFVFRREFPSLWCFS